MTNQEAFDTVCEHLAKQGRRAWLDEKGCLYRTPDGLKCAVGCLIPDTEYTPRMEEKNYNQRTWKEEELYTIPEVSAELLLNLQSAHDCPHYEAKDLRKRLRDIAGKYSLDTSVVKKIKVWETI